MNVPKKYLYGGVTMMLMMPDNYETYTHRYEEPEWEKRERLDYCDQGMPARDNLREMFLRFKHFFMKAA